MWWNTSDIVDMFRFIGIPAGFVRIPRLVFCLQTLLSLLNPFPKNDYVCPTSSR
jgi:hypothetical protein